MVDLEKAHKEFRERQLELNVLRRRRDEAFRKHAEFLRTHMNRQHIMINKKSQR